jgi:hypothetical protein
MDTKQIANPSIRGLAILCCNRHLADLENFLLEPIIHAGELGVFLGGG